MYIPPHFAQTEPGQLHRIMRTHPLGVLVTWGPTSGPMSGPMSGPTSGPTSGSTSGSTPGPISGPAGLDAEHIPFEFDPAAGPLGTLSAHVARANPLWQRCPTGTAVMVIFRGAEAYVSPSWYPSKHETHRQVPTWNYEVVHAHGRLTVRDDERFVRGLVARLTRQHEAAEPRPWKMGDSAPAFIDDMLGKIVGLEIEITSLTGKAKLGQNKEDRDRLGAADTLAARGRDELAQAMRQAR